MHELSKNIKIKIKTPLGITDERHITSTIMQGETTSSISCTTSVGKIAKDCPIEDYKYKGSIDIPQMSFVDDILDVKECGKQTKEMNKYTNSEITKRRLQLGVDKCVRVHISNN